MPRRPVVAGGWDQFVRSFLDGYFELHPTFASGAGRHEYDGRLPDWSPEAFEREIAWLRAERARAEEFDPATLDERRAFERELVNVVVDSDLFWLEDAEWHRRNPLFYAGASIPISISPATTPRSRGGCGRSSTTPGPSRARRGRCEPNCAPRCRAPTPSWGR